MRVAFFPHLPFHRPILEPVHDALSGRAACLVSADRSAVVAFDPHVLVLASHAHLEHFRHRLPGAAIVNVRHGLVDKAILRRLPRRPSARWFDFVCVGAEARLDAYERGGASPRAYWRTGYPQVDPLFRRDPPAALPLDPGRPTVLYAPTWNLGLSSAGLLGPRLVDLIRGEAGPVNVIIKPHPVIADWRPRWMAGWARLAAGTAGVHLVRDTHADVMPYLLAADLLVSDASSVIFEFLALDRPIVLVSNPRRTADPAYDPDDIIWRWREIGDEVHDPADLPGAVAAGLRAPGARAAARRRCARGLYGPFTDGRNHLRVAEKILETGAALARGERLPAAMPTAPGAPVARAWHDLRTRAWSSRGLRRLALGPLEELRLRARALGRRARTRG